MRAVRTVFDDDGDDGGESLLCLLCVTRIRAPPPAYPLRGLFPFFV